MRDNPIIWIAVLVIFIFSGYCWNKLIQSYLKRLASDEARLCNNRPTDPDSSSSNGVDTFK